MSINKDKNVREMTVHNMLALCHLGDKFKELNENLANNKFNKAIRDDYYDLLKLSKGERIIGGKKIKDFYNNNKEAIDIINKYSNIYYFIVFNYSDKGILDEDSDLKYFYNYIEEHKDKKENIVALLNKIKGLGINRFIFDESTDFSDKIFRAFVYFAENDRIIYLDNMVGVANFDDAIIEYKTTGSNYKIEVKRFFDEISEYEKRITINSLLFDPSLLPEKLSKDLIFENLIKLKEDQIDNCIKIQNSVNLSICVDDLCDDFTTTVDVVNRFNSVKYKNGINEVLKRLKKDLIELKDLSESYDEKITKNNSLITKEKLKKEKTKKVELRYWSDLD